MVILPKRSHQRLDFDGTSRRRAVGGDVRRLTLLAGWLRRIVCVEVVQRERGQFLALALSVGSKSRMFRDQKIMSAALLVWCKSNDVLRNWIASAHGSAITDRRALDDGLASGGEGRARSVSF